MVKLNYAKVADINEAIDKRETNFDFKVSSASDGRAQVKLGIFCLCNLEDLQKIIDDLVDLREVVGEQTGLIV